MDGKGGLVGIIGDYLGGTACWRQQHILFFDFYKVVDDVRNNSCFSSSGISFQDKNFILVFIGDEFGDVLEKDVLLIRRAEGKALAECFIELGSDH